MKLYEMILRGIGWWKDPPPESKVFNPVGMKVGNAVTLDILDFRNLNFFVQEIREIEANSQKFVDYVLLAKPPVGDDVYCRLRVVPGSYEAILLSLYDEMEYSEDFHNVVKDDSGKFLVDDVDEYSRVGGVKTSYSATVTILKDENGDGKVDENEVTKNSIEFWDFSRTTVVESVQREQFLFIEMDSENGWFQIWRGNMIGLDNVKPY